MFEPLVPSHGCAWFRPLPMNNGAMGSVTGIASPKSQLPRQGTILEDTMSNGKQNSGPYPGGPGKPQNSDDTNRTTSTSFTGGTGASGLGGEVGKTISSIMNMDESIETFAKKVAYAGLHGATGEQGQLGSLDDAIKNVDSLSSLSKKFADQVDKIGSIETILKDFNECQTTLDLVLNKTNAVNAYFAYMQGTRLRKIQRLRGNETDWIKWIAGELPNLKKRSREKYMSLASVPGVENHLEYGVERLAEFGSFFSSKSKNDRDKMGSDPFSWYMKKFNVNMETSYDERREHIDAVLEVSKLERLGIELPLDVMRSFLRVQDPLTGEERKHLKKLNENDTNKPTEIVALLNKIIAKELERKHFIAGKNPPPADEEPKADGDQGTPGTGADGAPAVTGPNIEKQVFTLCKSLESATTPEGIKLDSSIDRHVLMRLKSFIDQLLEMDQATQSAQDTQDADA